MGYRQSYRLLSEAFLQKKKKKKKSKCKHHDGELEGEFRFIENFIFKMNPLQFQVTTKPPCPPATHTHTSTPRAVVFRDGLQ